MYELVLHSYVKVRILDIMSISVKAKILYQNILDMYIILVRFGGQWYNLIKERLFCIIAG